MNESSVLVDATSVTVAGDLGRAADVHDLVVRAISGHATRQVQDHYSSVAPAEVRDGLAKVVALAGFRAGAVWRESLAAARVISCAEDLPQHVAVARGCTPDVTEILRDHGVMIDINDECTVGDEIAVQFEGALTPRRDDLAELVAGCGHIIVDECTGLPTGSLARDPRGT